MDNKNKDYSSIEKKLDSFLRPVIPEESFATNLKLRLLNEPGITIERPDYLFVVLFTGSLFFMGVLFIWLLNRIFNKHTE